MENSENRDKLLQRAADLIARLSPEQLAHAMAEALRAEEKESA